MNAATQPPLIRLLTTADLPAYKALRDIGLQHDPTAFTSDYETVQPLPASTYAARLGQPPDDHFTLGAFLRATALQDGCLARTTPAPSTTLIGAVVCEREARRKIRHQASLVGMVVAPQSRGQGVGRALLAAFDTLARQLPGLEQVLLSVTASNTAALRLYEDAGFRRYGLLARAVKIGNAYHDKALMVKLL
jgi:ribosomal protein S18 acetylase RimI-like enzyme